MRRRTGAIFLESRPATIIKSDWRGDPRNTSAPNRAMSYRDVLIAIISMAQQARPKVTGQIDDRRAHCTIFSTLVVRTGISASRPINHSTIVGPRSNDVAPPVEGALAPHIGVSREHQRHEQHDLGEAGPTEVAEGHRP